MYFSQKINHILSPKTIKIKESSCSLRKKKTWCHLFALYGNQFSKWVLCEDEFTRAIIHLKKSKVIQQTEVEPLVPWISSAQSLISLSEHSFTFNVTIPTLYLFKYVHIKVGIWKLVKELQELNITEHQRLLCVSGGIPMKMTS